MKKCYACNKKIEETIKTTYVTIALRTKEAFGDICDGEIDFCLECFTEASGAEYVDALKKAEPVENHFVDARMFRNIKCSPSGTIAWTADLGITGSFKINT